MVIGEKLYTADEFWEIAQLPENEDKRLALLDGVIVEVPPSSQKNTVTAARLYTQGQRYFCGITRTQRLM